MAEKKKYGWVMVIYLLGIFIGAIDTGILTPARTVVQASLGVDAKAGIWMITAFTLAYACSMPILGKVADRIGRKRVYMVAIAFFGTGSLICGLSNFTNSFPMLITGRVIQAFGGGGIMPLATAEFGTGFPEEKRGMALGLVGGVYGIANILGATLGSAVLDWVGVQNWHWLFFINLPICVTVIIAGLAALPKGEKKPIQRIDVPGTIVLVVMVLSLLYSINNLNFFDFGNTITAANVFPFLIVFALLIPVFLKIEKKAADPIFNTGYFRNKNIVLVFVMAFIVGVCLMGMVFVPQFAENALKTPEGSGGYFVTILGVFAGIGGPLSGKLVDKMGPKKILFFGFIVSIIGALFLALYATVYTSVAAVVISLVLVGTGLGFVMGTPLNYMMLENTKREDSNSALSALSLMRSIGTTIGPMIMIGFLAQAGIGAQDTIMNTLPPVSSINITADETLVNDIRADLIFVRDSLVVSDGKKTELSAEIDKLETLNNELKTATLQREADYAVIKADKTFKAMLEKMGFTIPENTQEPDFTEIRNMLNKDSGMTAADIDDKLKMLDFNNSSNMDFNMTGGTLPDDVQQRLENASVTTIVDDTKFLVRRMFEINTPSVITDIQDGIQSGIKGLQSGIVGMSDAQSGITEGINGITEGINGIGEGIKGADEGISGMSDGISGMYDAVKGIKKGIEGISGGISGLESGIAGIESAIAGMQSGIANLDSQILTLQQQINDSIAAGDPPSVWGPLQGQLSGLQAGKSSLQTQLEAAQAQKTGMEASLADMKEKVSSMKASVRSINSSKDKLSVLKEDVAAEQGYMIEIQTGMRNTVSIMQDMLKILQDDSIKMQDAKTKLMTLKEGISSYFSNALQSYLNVVDEKGAEIETAFQNAVNGGFTNMYYAVAVFAAVASLTLILYKAKKAKEKSIASDDINFN